MDPDDPTAAPPLSHAEIDAKLRKLVAHIDADIEQAAPCEQVFARELAQLRTLLGQGED